MRFTTRYTKTSTVTAPTTAMPSRLAMPVKMYHPTPWMLKMLSVTMAPPSSAPKS